jgi:23S rRNA pseudouridine2605 synthase
MKKTSKTEMNKPEPIRLNRFLAQLGVGSRRSCDDLIAAGKVIVDGKRVKRPGIKVVPGVNSVSVDGFKVERPARPTVLLLHKPTGVVSTVSDPENRPTVIDFCRKYGARKRLFPVGRLDVNTTGALLITNDGLLCYRLTHPSFEISKTYMVRVRGGYNDMKLARLQKMAGCDKNEKHPGRGGKPAVSLVKRLDKVTVLRITITEGRNRQVRNMCEAVGLRIVKLKRTNFGPISIRSLPLGSIRPLTKSELERLHNLTKQE